MIYSKRLIKVENFNKHRSDFSSKYGALSTDRLLA